MKINVFAGPMTGELLLVEAVSGKKKKKIQDKVIGNANLWHELALIGSSVTEVAWQPGTEEIAKVYMGQQS